MVRVFVEMARSVLVAALLLALISQAKAAEVADECFEQLPFGCILEKSVVVGEARTAEISEEQGATIERLSNTVLRVHGTRILVNVFDMPTDEDAMIRAIIERANSSCPKG